MRTTLERLHLLPASKNPAKHRPHVWWPLVLVWAGFIFYLSNQPDFGIQLSSTQGQIISVGAHFVEYFVLAWLLMYAFRSIGYTRRQALIITTVLAIVYGVTDEFHQSFVPGRTPSGADLLVDAIGAGTAMWLRPRVLAIIRRNKKHPA